MSNHYGEKSRMIRKELEIEGSDFYLTHLKLINALLPVELTNKEMLVLSRLLYFNFTESLIKKYKGNYRKYIRNILNLSSSSLFNYLSKMIKNGVIVNGDTGEVNQLLIPENTQEYYFRLKRGF